MWENLVWPGKDNIGRSGSTFKRIDKNLGNTESNLTKRAHHEKYMPSLPMHNKCFRGDTKILMSDGTQKEIRDIKIGDEVISHRGRFQTVIGTNERHHRGEFSRIILHDGQSLEATSDHKIMIERGGEFYWAEMKEVMAGDKLVQPKFKAIPSAQELSDKHIKESLSVNQIAKMYKVSRDTIYRWFTRYGIKSRNGSEANLVRFQDEKQRSTITQKANQKVRELASRGEWAQNFRGKPSWSTGLTKHQHPSLKKSSESKTGNGNPMYGKLKNQNAQYIDGRKSYRRYAFGLYGKKKECERCGAKEKLHIHHKDRNRKNNEAENLEVLCIPCHHEEHRLEIIKLHEKRNAKGQFQPITAG
jgi:5-methylcytosine-specific restriction endonuclease McrA